MKNTIVGVTEKLVSGLFILGLMATAVNAENGGLEGLKPANADSGKVRGLKRNRRVVVGSILPDPDLRITDVTASVNENDAVKSIDGHTNTRWGASGQPEIWVQYELSQSVKLDRVRFKIRDAQHDIPVEIMVGNDEENLERVCKAQTNTEEGGRGTAPQDAKWMNVSFNSTQGRYVRIVLHEGKYSGAEGKQLWLWEVRLGGLKWPDAYAHVTYLSGRDLQAVIDDVSPHTTVVCDPNRTITVSEKPIEIDKPLHLTGLRAELARGLAKTPLLLIQANYVTVEDFWLSGNKGSVPGKASLVRVEGNHFRIENGFVKDATRHGILATARGKNGGDRRDGVIRNITARNINRDGVSLEGSTHGEYEVRNIIVENVKAYQSRDRGAAEVCDGGNNVVFRDIYAKNCSYGVDVQDHKRRNTANRNIRIQGVHVNDCKMAVQTGNSAKNDHRNLTIRDVTRDGDKAGLSVSNTKGVTLDNIRIPNDNISIKNCSDVLRQ